MSKFIALHLFQDLAPIRHPQALFNVIPFLIVILNNCHPGIEDEQVYRAPFISGSQDLHLLSSSGSFLYCHPRIHTIVILAFIARIHSFTPLF